MKQLLSKPLLFCSAARRADWKTGEINKTHSLVSPSGSVELALDPAGDQGGPPARRRMNNVLSHFNPSVMC